MLFIYLAKIVNYFSCRQNPPGSLSGRHLGDAAHRLVTNSLHNRTADAHTQHHHHGHAYNQPPYVPPVPYQYGGYNAAPHGVQDYAPPQSRQAPPYQSRGGYQPRGTSGRFPSDPYPVQQSRGGHHHRDNRGGGGYSGGYNQRQQQQQQHWDGGEEHYNQRGGYSGQHHRQQGGDRNRRGGGSHHHHHDQGPRHRY